MEVLIPSTHYRRRMGQRPNRMDVVVAVVLTGSLLVEALLELTAPLVGALPVLLGLCVTIALVMRSVRPTETLVAALAAMTGQAALGSDLPGGFSEVIALVLALFSTGSRLPLRRSVVALGLGVAGSCTMVGLSPNPRPANFVYVVTLVGAGWAAGRVVALSGERGRLLAQHRADQERSRIARELHDVVSHHVSAIVIQAGARRRDLDPTDPTAGLLAQIEDQGRQTLQELRRLLGLLRVDDDTDVPLAPQPGLADLPGLIQSMRDRGCEVSFETVGQPRAVGQGLELAIYRVVQESLTNMLKHAQEPRADVALRWDDAQVDVEVLSGVPAHRHLVPGGGLGLRSMSERVRAYGGLVSARRTAEGFRVHATLPLEAAR